MRKNIRFIALILLCAIFSTTVSATNLGSEKINTDNGNSISAQDSVVGKKFAVDVLDINGEYAEATIANMERITSPVDFGFEIVSVGRDSVVAEFVSQSRIPNPPYVGVKGTKTTAEKNSEYQYVLEYEKEYSFEYSVIENGVETIYNSFLKVESGENTSVVFDDIIKNVVSNELTRAARTKTEIESNNTYSDADRTYDDYNNYGTINPATDADWWVVSFLNSGDANFWLGDIPVNCDYELELYSSNGTTRLDYSYHSGNEAELITYPVTAGVNYYIKIYSYSGSSTSQYLFRTKNYPTNTTDRTLTFVIYNADTGTEYTGPATISIRGYYHNADHTTRSIVNIEGSTDEISLGYNVGYNVRANGYHTYVSPTNDIDVSESQVIRVYLEPVGTSCSDANFARPLSYCNTTSNFGWRSWKSGNSTYNNNFNKHNGVDFSGTNGVTDIYSICDIDNDDIVVTNYDGSRGNYVQVTDTESAKTITYMHMYQRVYINAPVAKGVTIGKVGNTGTSTAPHLHIEIYDDETNLYHDPLLYFNMTY